MRTLPHAILIEGGNESKRSQKAAELLVGHFSDDPAAEMKLRQGTFEDLLVLEPDEGKDITVDKIEALVSRFKQKPFASTGKACMIPCGERMNEHAQNKLLKLLEEPVPGDVILILAENAESLLPTVRSRCMRIWLGYTAPEKGRQKTDLRLLTGSLIYGKDSFAEAAQILSQYESSRDEAADFVRAFQLFLRSLIVGRYASELIGDDADDREWFRESASKVAQKHADRMRRGILTAERALRDLERGVRVRYALRGMALTMRADIDNIAHPG